MTLRTCSWTRLIDRRLADRQWIALAFLMISSLAVQLAAAEEFELSTPEGTVVAEGMPLPEELPNDAAGDEEFPSDRLGAPAGSVPCNDCPHDASCWSGGRCDTCEPPYGALNRLIDNKHACWTFRTDALLLWRDSPRSRPLIDTFPGGLPALNANQLNSTPAAGPRFSLFRTDGCGDALEATYFRAANFRAQSVLPTVSDGYAPVFAPVPTTYDSVSANLGSALQSFELNGRMTVLPTIQLLGGFRWFEWRESLQIVGNSAAVVPPIRDVVNTSCTNSLYGYQIGFDSLLLSTKWLRLEGLMKGGAYYNNAVQSTSATTEFGPYSARVGSPAAASFLGEVGLTGVIPITRNIDFRVGYLGLWLQGLAQPTLQTATLDPAVAATLNTTGAAVVQGVTLGAEGRW